MSSVVNQTPYLRTTRNFPAELQQLTVEIDRSYVDIANAVNNRIIALFPTSKPAVNGESWFINGQRYQGQRQVYILQNGVTTYAHGISNFDQMIFTAMYGQFKDSTSNKWYLLPYVDVLNVNNQVGFFVDSTNINIVIGAGTPPTISTGIFRLEWIVPVDKFNI